MYNTIQQRITNLSFLRELKANKNLNLLDKTDFDLPFYSASLSDIIAFMATTHS